MAFLRPANSVNNNTVANNEVVSSEYWANWVYVFPEEIDPDTGKPAYISIPTMGTPLDALVEACVKQAPTGKADMSKLLNRLKSKLPAIAKNLLDVAKSLAPGQREIVFLCDQTDEEGNPIMTGYAIELYHKDPNAKKLAVEDDKLTVKPLNKIA